MTKQMRIVARIASAQVYDALLVLKKLGGRIDEIGPIVDADERPSKPNGKYNRYKINQQEFLKAMVEKNPGILYQDLREQWTKAGLPPDSFYAGVSRSKGKGLIKHKGDKLFPAGGAK